MASSLDVRTRNAAPGNDGGGNDPDDNTAAIATVWILIGFKVFSIILILALHTSPVSLWLMFWLNAPWVIVGVVMTAGIWFAWVRLWRVRLKRRKLIRAEWQTTPTDTDTDTGPRGRPQIERRVS